MLQVHNLSKGFAGRNLFTEASIALSKGEHVGLVGRNGSGKSTLFRILIGQINADHGDIVLPKNYRLAHLEQHLNFTAESVLEECIKGLPADERHEHYRVEKILMGLGFTREDLAKSPLSFSGGQQIRFNLCKILVNPPDLLLLDEPTNYLDIVGMRWFSFWLKTFPGELILITHDRSFMDQACNSIMGIYRQKIRSFKGNTEHFYTQLAEEEEIYQKTRANQQKKVAETQRFIDRFRAKASKAGQAQSRQKMLNKLILLEELDHGANLDFNFNEKDCPGKVFLYTKNLSFGYEEQELLFKNLNVDLKSDDRIAIIGPNGKGKSTLLNILGGFLAPKSGEIWRHPSNSVGHFGQTNIDRLYGPHTILQELALANSDLTQEELRRIAGTMMFPGDDALKKIRLLSGGEKARVLLGKILAGKHNILLLDEPTNHLDQESVEALCQGIDQFSGAVVIVTHNENIIRQLATKLIVFQNQKAQVVLESYDDFLTKIGWETEQIETEVQTNNTEKVNLYQLKKKKQLLTQEMNRQSTGIKKEMTKAEEKVTQAEDKLKRMQEDLLLISQDTSVIGSKIVDLSKSISYQEREVEKLFSAYEKISEDYQKVVSTFEIEIAQILNGPET